MAVAGVDLKKPIQMLTFISDLKNLGLEQYRAILHTIQAPHSTHIRASQAQATVFLIAISLTSRVVQAIAR